MHCVLIFAFITGITAAALPTQPPQWSNTYSLNGSLYLPFAEIEEPFSVWYDEPKNRSRIDYYGGMVKNYLFGSSINSGMAFIFNPVSNAAQISEMTCTAEFGYPGSPIVIQSMLPDTTGFQLVGTETLFDYECNKFQLKETVGQQQAVYTLWVRYENMTPIPVRFELRTYYDQYHYDYYSYDNQVSNEAFELDLSMGCSGSGETSESRSAPFNPMQEFIHHTTNRHVEHAFKQFRMKHNVKYANEQEHEYRKNIFKENLKFIHSKNSEKLGYTLAVNRFADKTADELKGLRGFKSSGTIKMGKPFPYNLDNSSVQIPDQYDWRLYGAVTPVKDQAECGSCWSFGTTGQLEAALFFKNGGNLVSLSQQALIDCSWQYGNYGCGGGSFFNAYAFMLQVGGIPTEEDYGPYLEQDGYCHLNNVSLVAPITGYVDVTPYSPQALKIALLKNGPISVAIDASQPTFQFYSHGIYYDANCSSDQLDHAVLVVGYGTINGEDYWLVKNSWSIYWGDDGYILMSTRNNNCGVMTEPCYAEM